MSAKLRDLDRDLRRMRAPHSPVAMARAASARRKPRVRAPVRSMVVDFGEPATFGAGAHAMSIDPAVAQTDVAWENAVSDALAARDDVADSSYEAAAFVAHALGEDEFEESELAGGDTGEDFDDDKGHEDFEELQSHDEEEAEAAAGDDDAQGGGMVLAKGGRRAIIDDDDRFWSVARAADAARTQLANDPGLAELHAPSDPETEADDELRRDLEQLQQRPVEAPVTPDAAPHAPVSAHSIFDRMTMATTFDVGTVEVTRTFDALDAELDRADARQQRVAARTAQRAAPAPLAIDETVEDLSWIQQAIEREDTPPSEQPAQPDAATSEPSIEPPNHDVETERSAP